MCTFFSSYSRYPEKAKLLLSAANRKCSIRKKKRLSYYALQSSYQGAPLPQGCLHVANDYHLENCIWPACACYGYLLFSDFSFISDWFITSIKE